MKKVLVVIILLMVLGGAGYFFLNKSHTNPSITPNPLPSQAVQTTSVQNNTASGFCIPSQIEAIVAPEGAAGNIYAQVTIKNISKTSCDVVGNNELSLQYPQSVQNLKTVSKKQATTQKFTLAPNQTIYSLIHFPNGPQCSGPVTPVNASLDYQISSTDTITFKPSSGNTLNIPSCDNQSEITTIDLYPFSEEPPYEY